MRMRIYHNLENNQLEAYVLADEGRALSGQKKSIREALPECIRKINHGLIPKIVKVDPTSRIYVDGYGVIEMVYYLGYRQLRAGSRERLCNTRLARNKFIEFDDGYMDEMKTAVSAVLRNESACRRANGLDTAVRFGFQEESAERVLVAVWEGDSWAEPEPEPVETVEVEPAEVEHDGVVDVEMVGTAEIPVVTVEPRMVESAPSLPAECSAETQEIPEVPPQTNGDAHVLAVSEAVIPGGMSVAEMFPSVPYRAVRAFKRVVARADGTVSKKKVAYAFRMGDVVQVLRRDRYVDAGADQAVESEIAAYVAKLKQAA